MNQSPKKLVDGSTIKALFHERRAEWVDGKPVYKPECDLEGQSVRLNQVDSEHTIGRFGPNGNGYNYWCKRCEMRCTPSKNPYSALAALVGN